MGLGGILQQAGSAWTVWTADEPLRLTRVVDPRLQAVAEEVLGDGLPSAEFLSRAWRAGYGVSPDGQAAYDQAVKAIESALWPLVEPNNEKATLGTMLPELRKRERFNILFTESHGSDPLADFTASLSLLWCSQYRHATGHGAIDGSKVANSLAQGRAALLLATVVVQWLTDGVLTAR